MNPNEQAPSHDDRLLQRYREANELDAARPGPALRETVLEHARSVAASRAEAVAPAARPAANDSVWTWRALGSLAVIGLVGLLVLQFDRDTPDEQEAALGTGVLRPAVQPAPAPEAKAPAAAAVASASSPVPSAPKAPGSSKPALAEAQGSAPVGSSLNATEGLSRKQREVTTASPAATTAPLFAAIAAGDLNAVKQGLREGADPSQRGVGGQTPLMAAARRGNEAIVRLLLAAGADHTLRDLQGLSAADHAERSGHSGLLPLLQ